MFLVNISVINGYKRSILLLLESIMGPETIVKGEEMLFFILASILMDYGGIVFHFNARNTSEKLLSLVEGTNSDGNFDTHNLIVRILLLYSGLIITKY